MTPERCEKCGKEKGEHNWGEFESTLLGACQIYDDLGKPTGHWHPTNRFTPARDGREGQAAVRCSICKKPEQEHWQGLWCSHIETDGDKFTPEFSPSPVQPQPGWLAALKEHLMDIYSPPGTKVVFANPHGGYPCHQEDAKKHLVVGQTYTVKKTTVYDSRSTVEFEEVPGKTFNTVLFAPEDKFRREGGERKSFKELAEIARKSPHYELEGAILALTEDRNEKPLLELFESLRARLAEVERERCSKCGHIAWVPVNDDRKRFCQVCEAFEIIKCIEDSAKENTDYINDQCGTKNLEDRCAVRIVVDERDRLRAENAALREELEKFATNLDVEATWYVPGSHVAKGNPQAAAIHRKFQGLAKQLRQIAEGKEPQHAL